MKDPRGVVAPNLIEDTPLFVDESTIPRVFDDARDESTKIIYSSIPKTYSSTLEKGWERRKSR
jgi:hypothetical protein